MKTPKSSSSSKTAKKRTPKSSQPKPLQVVHSSPSLDAPPSSSQEPQKSNTPKSTMHAEIKRPHSTPKGISSSRPTKMTKQVDPNSAEEIAKENLSWVRARQVLV
jgi:hypothetical protein